MSISQVIQAQKLKSFWLIPILTVLISQLIDIIIFFGIRVKNYLGAKKIGRDPFKSRGNLFIPSLLGSRPGSYRQVFTVNLKEKKI